MGFDLQNGQPRLPQASRGAGSANFSELAVVGSRSDRRVRHGSGAQSAPHSAQGRCRPSTALESNEGREAAGSAATLEGEPVLARDV